MFSNACLVTAEHRVSGSIPGWSQNRFVIMTFFTKHLKVGVFAIWLLVCSFLILPEVGSYVGPDCKLLLLYMTYISDRLSVLKLLDW